MTRTTSRKPAKPKVKTKPKTKTKTKTDRPLTEAELDLKDANRIVDKGLLRMFYQPIVDLSNGEVFAYEALCRPRSRRLKSPRDLVTAAVRAGRIGELGRQQRAEALKNCPDVPLFVNIDPHEFDQGWLVRPDDAFFRHRRPTYLEITETVPIKFFDQCHSVLAELRKKGVLLAIDDLGAGFSNLKYIAELEPDIVKLDRDLVAGSRCDTRQFGLLESITRLCHEMGARVVAEGVETKAELEAVIEAGADYCQGYLLARPASSPPSVDAASFRFGRQESAMPVEPEPKAEPEPEPQPVAAAESLPSVAPTGVESDEERLRREVESLLIKLDDSERLQHELSRRLNEMSVVNRRLRSQAQPATRPAETSELTSAETLATPAQQLEPASFRPKTASLLSAVAAVVAFVVLIGLAPMVSAPPAVGGEPLPEKGRVEVPATEVASAQVTETRDSGSLRPTVHEVDRQAARIARRVGAWAEAWSSQRLHDYLSFYSVDFELPEGLERKSWEADRRLKIGSPGSISVKIEHLETSFPDGKVDVARVRFDQLYESDRYRDKVRKTLELALEDGEWRIRREWSNAV